MSLLTKKVPPIVLDCVCCGQRISRQNDYCPACETPVTLSHTVATRMGNQNFISVLGASNAGKTVYLGMLLDMLSKGPESFRGFATSAFSIDLQEQVITSLENRTFPEKTPSEADAWNWLHCQIAAGEGKQSRNIDLISPDFAGEAIAMEIDQSGTYPAIGHVVTKSGGLLILCDSLRVRDAGSGEDLFAMKVASYIAQQHGLTNELAQSKSSCSEPAIAIVFTKCDGCPEALENPTQFAAYHASRLFEFCRRTFSKHEFFASSVVGSSGLLSDSTGRQMQMPFHIQPQGIIEPLQWIVGQQ